MKEKFKKLGEQVVKNKGKIAFVAGVAVVGFIGFKKYQYKFYISGAEKIQIEAAKGAYVLFNFGDGSQVLAGDNWGILGDKGAIQPEVIIDALRNTFGLVE